MNNVELILLIFLLLTKIIYNLHKYNTYTLHFKE